MKRRTTTSSLVHGWLALAAFGIIASGSVGVSTSCAPDPICGDDVVNLDDEECDGDDFDGDGCAQYGFDVGQLSCRNSCKVDTAACVILDQDLDGLVIYDELALGTDPLNPDSDGDGLLDGDEVQNGSNPLDMYSWPQGQGKWPNRLQASIDAGVTPTGWAKGQVAYNGYLIDQYGQDVQLYQFYGYPIVVSVGAVWCGPCNQAAATSQDLFAEKFPQGVIFVEELVDGKQPGVDATDADIQGWANKYGIQFPVTRLDGIPPPASAIPTFYLINSDMTVNRKVEGYPGDATLSTYIDALH